MRVAGRKAARDERGAAAVEFGLISIPFFATIFFLAESGYNFFIQSQLESATVIASRQVMIGAAQSSGLSMSDVRSEICSRLFVGSNCTARLYVDIRSYDANVTAHLDPVSVNQLDNKFCLGGPGQYTIVKVAYAAPVVASIWQTSPVIVNGVSVRMMRAATAFRNEPYNGAAGTVC
ncbi:MAG: TadE/TadG family type IV pilus assembly protein [Beijerinckiaceae bacterium]